jgi:hypothetical protein
MIYDFQPCTAVVWDCLIVGLLWLHHIQSLAYVTMATNASDFIIITWLHSPIRAQASPYGVS